MQHIGIIYGSDTGVTEEITDILIEIIGDDTIEIIEIEGVQESDFQKFGLLLLGLSTWYDGDLQSGWEDYYDTFTTIDFTDKIVALYGVGDQHGYPHYYVDGIGILAQVILANGGTIIGNWSAENYDIADSKALMDEHTFYGLALDEDNQPELTKERITKWVEQLKIEFSKLDII